MLAVHEEETKFKESKDVVVEVGFPKHGLDNDAVITYFKVTAVQVNVSSNPCEIHLNLENCQSCITFMFTLEIEAIRSFVY